jgi:hypothetical protein
MNRRTLYFPLVAAVLALLMAAAPLDTAAQPRLRMKSRKVLNRTNLVLAKAKIDVKQGQVYTGKLSLAVRHQRLARVLHRRGMFVRAINHSRRARVLAFAAIQANNQPVPAEYQFQGDEAGEGTMSDAQLDAAAATEMPDGPTTDQQATEGPEEDVQ